MLKTPDEDVGLKVIKRELKKTDIPYVSVFRPPEYDTNYFYYTRLPTEYGQKHKNSY